MQFSVNFIFYFRCIFLSLDSNRGVIELNKMSAIEAKLDALMNKVSM